jgi:hypothetical protein
MTRSGGSGGRNRRLRVGGDPGFGGGVLLRGFSLNLRRGELKTLDDPEEALIDFAPDALPFLRRHLLERAVGRDLAEQLAADRREVDLHVRRIVDGGIRCSRH